ncbi:hypothetical protein BGZ76_001624 [Entomortierella beljakovae]|nr:hypothetical protein BGZ76_001624 [Entomortierella beljakovae]
MEFEVVDVIDSPPERVNSSAATVSDCVQRPMTRREIDMESFGIPWGIKPTYNVKNTCALDSTLMAWYLLQYYNAVRMPLHVRNLYLPPLITQVGHLVDFVMTLIGNEKYDFARVIWCSSLNIGACEERLPMIGQTLLKELSSDNYKVSPPFILQKLQLAHHLTAHIKAFLTPPCILFSQSKTHQQLLSKLSMIA